MAGRSPTRHANGTALGRYLGTASSCLTTQPRSEPVRTIAIGRKNWFFAGSGADGERAATIYSPIASAKRHQIEPFAYLRELFERPSTHPADRIHELALAKWAVTNAPKPD